MALIFTDFPPGSGSQACALLEICEYQRHSLIFDILNLFKVLKSSESGAFNCINTVGIASTFLFITSLIFDIFNPFKVSES